MRTAEWHRVMCWTSFIYSGEVCERYQGCVYRPKICTSFSVKSPGETDKKLQDLSEVDISLVNLWPKHHNSTSRMFLHSSHVTVCSLCWRRSHPTWKYKKRGESDQWCFQPCCDWRQGNCAVWSRWLRRATGFNPDQETSTYCTFPFRFWDIIDFGAQSHKHVQTHVIGCFKHFSEAELEMFFL